MSSDLKQEVMLMMWKQWSYQNLSRQSPWWRSEVISSSEEWIDGAHTARFNSSLSGEWMHLSSSRPPAADWMGQNPVCHGVALPFPESSTWNHSLLFSGSGQGRHCESVEFLLTPSHWEVHHHHHRPVQCRALRAAMLQCCTSGDMNRLVPTALLSCEFYFKHNLANT